MTRRPYAGIVLKFAATIASVIVVTLGCGPKAKPPGVPPRKPAISGLPVEMTVKQRTTTAVPGSNELLRITIEDITGGQAVASLASDKGQSVLATTSLKEGESAIFALEGDEYRLTLDELENDLVGEDFATFVISSRSAAASEREKIEALLSQIESGDGATFIRNGAEHSPEAAADHLRTKWQAAGDEVKTANDFIEKIASKSSLSDEPYRVRLADGIEVLASDYLKEQLRQIESRQARE